MAAHLLFSLFGLSASESDLPSTNSDIAIFILTSVLIAPVLETLLLAWLFSSLTKVKLSATTSAAICIIALSSAHAVQAPYKALIVAIPASIFMLPFIRERGANIKHCTLLSINAHALHNSYAVIAFLAS